MVGEKRQQQRSNSNNNKRPLLCFFSVVRRSFSLSSPSSAAQNPKRENCGISAGAGGGIIILRRSFRHRHFHHHHHQSFLPIFCLLLVVVFIFSFLSPPVSDHLLLRRRSTSQVEGLINVDRNKSGDLWSTSSSESYYGCSNASKKFLMANAKTHPDRYLLISTSGGLNQQRTGITDAVVAAYILNATLIVPMLDQKSYWKDASEFEDIFDVDWFISFLSNDVKIIKKLPTVGGKVLTPVRTRVPRKCSPKYYIDRILPLLNKKHAVQLTKYDYRLSNNLETDLQKLRCRVNYHALRFIDPILEMGRKLVERMRMRSKHFLALHLRFEPDMLAFSGCEYGGGEKETKELGSIRRRWKTLHKSNPDKQRRQGRCPLSPEEVGLMLRALGFGSDVHIYVASGEIYGGEETLAPLRALFPNIHSKDSIATQEELAPFASYSARMAALDFIVCDESDAFVTNNNGNMARILAGRRRYYGHKPTIRPNAKKLYQVFLNRNNMTWEEFASGVRTHQAGFMGDPNEVSPRRGEFHENPSSCICESSSAKARGDSAKNKEHSFEDEQDLTDTDEVDSENVVPEKESTHGSNWDPSVIVTSDHPELEELVSD